MVTLSSRISPIPYTWPSPPSRAEEEAGRLGFFCMDSILSAFSEVKCHFGISCIQAETDGDLYVLQRAYPGPISKFIHYRVRSYL